MGRILQTIFKKLDLLDSLCTYTVQTFYIVVQSNFADFEKKICKCIPPFSAHVTSIACKNAVFSFNLEMKKSYKDVLWGP